MIQLTRRALLYTLIAATIFTIGFLVFTESNSSADDSSPTVTPTAVPEPQSDTLIPATPRCDNGEYPYMIQHKESPNEYSCDGEEWFGLDQVPRYEDSTINEESQRG